LCSRNNTSSKQASKRSKTGNQIHNNKKSALVRLGQLDRLAPAQVALVHERGEPAELEQLVLLEAAREPDLVEVVVRRDGRAQAVVVLLLDQQVCCWLCCGWLCIGWFQGV
jgi:hypothetical protein